MHPAHGAAPIHFVIIPDTNHFAGLAPASELIARQLMADTAPSFKLDLTPDMIVAAKAAPGH